MWYLFSAIFFIALSILSFGIQLIVYDASTGTFVTYNEANFTLQTLLPFGISTIFAIISGLELILLIGIEWNKNLKGLKTPLDKQ